MLTYLRYALATICFALSVACLGLWGLSSLRSDKVDYVTLPVPPRTLAVQTCGGGAVIWLEDAKRPLGWHASPLTSIAKAIFAEQLREQGRFGTINSSVFFPLWYPALVFALALASVSILRLGRRFTLRSSIIATTVVAGLLGMVVAL